MNAIVDLYLRAVEALSASRRCSSLFTWLPALSRQTGNCSPSRHDVNADGAAARL
jgi:hypothetical protein